MTGGIFLNAEKKQHYWIGNRFDKAATTRSMGHVKEQVIIRFNGKSLVYPNTQISQGDGHTM